MRDSPRGRLILPFLILLGMTSCMDRSPTVLEEAAIPLQASHIAGDCGQVAALDGVKDYFTLNTERQTARAIVRDIGTNCSAHAADAADAVSVLAIELLVMVETAFNAGRVGNAALGSTIVNAALSCTKSLCRNDALPSPAVDFAPALGSAAGLFAVRSDDNRPAVARDWVDFTDEPDDTDNRGLWGADVATSWKVPSGEDLSIVYGWPTTTALQPYFEDLGYDVNIHPKKSPFPANEVHVWICFEEDAALPHPHDQDYVPVGRLVRNSSSLLPVEDSFEPSGCPSALPGSLQNASIFAPVAGLLRSLVPRSLFAFAMRTDTRTPHVGGSPLDFSLFTLEGADPNGYLEWDWNPTVIYLSSSGGLLGVGQVTAKSGNDSPLQNAKIRLHVEGNSGSPAGAVVINDVAWTDDAGVAWFSTAKIEKTGGYIVCATAEFPGFQFDPICTPLFHIRK